MIIDNLNILNVSMTFPQSYFIIADRTSVFEGSSVIFTVTATSVSDGTILYWTNSGTSVAGDFSDGLNSGSVTVTNGSATITRTLLDDATSETGETIILQLRTGSTSGTIVATSQTVTILDITSPRDQSTYVTAGTYSFTVPDNVYSISILTIGGGEGGSGANTSGNTSPSDRYGDGGKGGYLAYRNNFSVTPGDIYEVVVGAGGSAGLVGDALGGTGGDTYVRVSGGGAYVVGAPGGGNTTSYGSPTASYAGGAGGQKVFVLSVVAGGGGGGAGGYSGVGGNGGTSSATVATRKGGDGQGGAGAGGSVNYNASSGMNAGAGGGGTGIYGQGTSGVGIDNAATLSRGGGAGSLNISGLYLPANGANNNTGPPYNAGSGGRFGGGGGGGAYSSGGGVTASNGGAGGVGAVRILWPGNTRTYPTTNVTDLSIIDAPIITSVGTISGSGTSANITYTAPTSPGGTVTSYTAVSEPGGVIANISQSGSGTITMTGLTQGQTYTFTVFATTSSGIGPRSAYSSSLLVATVPGAPTIKAVTASQTSSPTATIEFAAPINNGGSAITSYTAVSSPGGVTGTVSQANSGNITITGLSKGQTYTFTVYATNSIGNSANSVPSSSVTIPNIGQQEFITAGTYSWTVPTGVTKISVVSIGGGQGGREGGTGGAYTGAGGAGGQGGSLTYLNNYSVTPGQTVDVYVGAGGTNNGNGGNSYISISGTQLCGAPGGGRPQTPFGSYTAYGAGGAGGLGYPFVAYDGGGGGGAGGYGGAGGNGCNYFGYAAGTDGSNGGGGGGSSTRTSVATYGQGGGGGGGTGIYGQGANGVGQTYSSYVIGGGGGSGGTDGTSNSFGNQDPGTPGGSYGGGGGGGSGGDGQLGGVGGGGAVRIIWPGDARTFPTTRTANE